MGRTVLDHQLPSLPTPASWPPPQVHAYIPAWLTDGLEKLWHFVFKYRDHTICYNWHSGFNFISLFKKDRILRSSVPLKDFLSSDFLYHCTQSQRCSGTSVLALCCRWYFLQMVPISGLWPFSVIWLLVAYWADRLLVPIYISHYIVIAFFKGHIYM